MSQIGRIGGQVLTDNLLRAGVDLAFETDLLYLKVNPVIAGSLSSPNFEDGDPNFGKPLSTTGTLAGIGVKTDVPIYDLDVNNHIRTTDLTVDTQAALGNLRINSPNTITTSVGGIDVFINGSEIFHDRLVTRTGSTNFLLVDGNKISSFANNNIVFDPNGAGQILITADTYVDGNLGVSGNINVNGNLSSASDIIVGDQTLDTVTINTDFTQSIIPGDDLTYALGADAGDSSPRRWDQVFSPDWTKIDSGAGPGSGLATQNIYVSDQILLNGVNRQITTIQSNDDLFLLPDTGITIIENTRWQNSDITNLSNTALTIANTGIGYTNILGTNAMVIPAGTDAERRLTPEVGETRWNTDQQYLECFDGTVWAVSIGGTGGTVTANDMDDLSNIYTLVLG